MRACLALVAAFVVAPRIAAADGRLLDDDSFAVTSTGTLTLDGSLVVGTPSALPSGVATGIGAGLLRTCGCHFGYGVRAAYETASGASQFWTVSHGELRLRAIGEVFHRAGRGSVALRLGLGPTIVHESRTRAQSMGAGRSDLDTSSFATLPAADLEIVFAVHITGPFVAVVNAGPTFDRFDGALRTGFTAGLGVAWQP